VDFRIGRRSVVGGAFSIAVRRGQKRIPAVALGRGLVRRVQRRGRLKVKLVFDGLNRADRYRKFVRTIVLTS